MQLYLCHPSDNYSKDCIIRNSLIYSKKALLEHTMIELVYKFDEKSTAMKR